MKYFTKTGMAIDYSAHFWDRAFGRPKVKEGLEEVRFLMENAGPTDANIEDVQSLKHLLNQPKKRFYYQKTPTSAKYIFDLKKDPITKKHKFVAVTGLLPEHTSYNLVDITRLINNLN